MGFSLDLKAVEQSKVSGAQDRDLLPEGLYAVRVSGCEPKASNAGHPFFAFEFTVDQMPQYPDNPFVGRKVWNNLMISHPNPAVTEISQKVMADILIACGVGEDSQIDDLENDFPMLVMDKPLWVRIYHKVDKIKDELRPEIASYVGRGEFEGSHRYDKSFPTPSASGDDSVSANPSVCKKTCMARDDKLMKQMVRKKLQEQGSHGGYSTSPMSDVQRAKSHAALNQNFEDVPF